MLIDIDGHKNEVSLLIIHIEVCVHKLNDAGCLKHQVNKIYLRLVLGWVDLHGQSWKIMLENEKVVLRFIGVPDTIDTYEKREWP